MQIDALLEFGVPESKNLLSQNLVLDRELYLCPVLDAWAGAKID